VHPARQSIGTPGAEPDYMMFTKQLATRNDIVRRLGEIDPLTIARILAIAPTIDELGQAVDLMEDELGFADEPRTPSSARVANVRAVLSEIVADERAPDPRDEWRAS
jgi:hypothetical protein